jgi:hypothetical protein
MSDLHSLIWKTYALLCRMGYAEMARGVVGKDYDAIRTAYGDDIYQAMKDYLDGDRAITSFRNRFRRAVLDYFDAAFFTGYMDAGGAVNEISDDDKAWLIARQEQEIGYVDSLFQSLKTLRADAEESKIDPFAMAIERSITYSKTLDGVYAEGKLRGGKNVMLTLDGDDGQESCPTCQRLKGARHSAKWWTDRGLIPGQPGNPNYECRGYNCRHYLVDDQGNLYTPSI